MRLFLGVNLTDTWCRFALRLPGLHRGLPTTHGFLPSFSSLQCLGVHVSHTVPEIFALFLVVEQPLLHPNVHNHPAHSTLASSNSAAFLHLAPEKANHGAQVFVLEPALCLCCFKSCSAWLAKVIQCPNTP